MHETPVSVRCPWRENGCCNSCVCFMTDSVLGGRMAAVTVVCV